MRATISLFAMKAANPDLFKEFQVPQGLDKETLTDKIFMECVELEMVYPNPFVLQGLIGVWSKSRLDVWQHLFNTTQYEYNPIENYDRKTDEWETGDSKSTEERDLQRTSEEAEERKTDSSRESGTTTGVTGSSTITNSGQDEVEHSKAGFNAVSLVPDERTITNPGSSSSTQVKSDTTVKGDESGSVSESGTTTGTETDTGTVKRGGSNVVHRAGNVHGNIGVTTTQQMIEQERAVAQFDLYKLIAEEFKCEFCLLVY